MLMVTRSMEILLRRNFIFKFYAQFNDLISFKYLFYFKLNHVFEQRKFRNMSIFSKTNLHVHPFLCNDFYLFDWHLIRQILIPESLFFL